MAFFTSIIIIFILEDYSISNNRKYNKNAISNID